MNLGQRIYKKYLDEEEIINEIKEIEAIINQISQNEEPIPEIDLNLDFKTIYKELETYIKTVDEKLFEIQKKYFEPNGLHFNICICKTELADWSYISVDLGEDTVNQPEYEFLLEKFCKWNENLFNNLLAALNINKLAMLLGATWHIKDFGEDENFKVIETISNT